MSYLDPPRVHFAGRFLAAISTVNNDVAHFDTANFQASYQLPTGPDQPDGQPGPANGLFNPQGSGDWRLIDVAVTSAIGLDGAAATDDDVVRTALVADSDRRAPAKLVDLDPEQQLVSTIWGLEVRLTTADGQNLVRGQFRAVAFTDIWSRATGRGALGDIGGCAMYQSVLTDLEWGDVAASPVLVALRERSSDRLSIKFNLDGINLDASSPDFMTGRIVGTIGPAAADEPGHFVAGRQFQSFPRPGPSNFFSPANGVNHCVGAVDEAARCVRVDLGNALPTSAPGGPPASLGTLQLILTADQTFSLGQIGVATYTDPGWYASTAGVVTFPPDRPLTADELSRVNDWPLLLIGSQPGSTGSVRLIAEHPSGLHVRADRFVYRLNPGEHADVRLIATRFGRRYAGASVVAQPYSDQFQVGRDDPAVMTPPDGLHHPDRVVTDDDGVAVLPIYAHDPGNPRGYVDGQIYGIYPALEETLAFSPAQPYPFDQWSFVSVLVWDAIEDPEDPPTWHQTVEPIFQQYANLYPVMRRFLDMASYDDVVHQAKLLERAFALDEDDPNVMPVTRDLSGAKRAAILSWLRHPGPDGKPRRGTPLVVRPTPHAAAAADRALAPDLPESAGTVTPAGPVPMGGKTSAFARRLVNRAAKTVLDPAGPGSTP